MYPLAYVPPHLHSTMWVMYAFAYAWIRTISPTCLMLCRVVNTERAGGQLPPPPPLSFCESVYHIPTRGKRLCPPHYYLPFQISDLSTALLCRKVREPKAILCIQNLSELVNRMSRYFLFLCIGTWYTVTVFWLNCFKIMAWKSGFL